MQWKKTLQMAAVATALSFGIAGAASADTGWQIHHARREEVNNRLNNLNHRISVQRAEGELSARQGPFHARRRSHHPRAGAF